MSSATEAISVGRTDTIDSAAERRVIIASSVGTVFEWYDFYLYAILAPFFAALFFPPGNQTAALLGAFGAYAAGFLVRPFGALDALTRRSMQDELLRIWTELKQTIAFVTHGIEESLLLADRVVVMTYRPGTVKKIIPVALPRPRDETTPEFSAALRAITQMVREEQRRHEQAEQT